MVFTIPVHIGRLISRRSFLAAVGAVGTAGLAVGTTGSLSACTLSGLGGDKPETLSAEDTAALRSVATEAALLASRYDSAIAAQPAQANRLTTPRDAHRAHAAALAEILGEGPSAAATSGGSSTTLKALVETERAAAERAAAACQRTRSHHALLLASIAACRASHAEALS